MKIKYASHEGKNHLSVYIGALIKLDECINALIDIRADAKPCFTRSRAFLTVIAVNDLVDKIEHLKKQTT